MAIIKRNFETKELAEEWIKNHISLHPYAYPKDYKPTPLEIIGSESEAMYMVPVGFDMVFLIFKQ